MNTNPLDSLSILGVYIFTFVLLLICAEIGYQLAKVWMRKRAQPKEGPGALASVTLGLLAFLTAFVIGMGASRFDTRKQLVLAEANSIGTTDLRTGFLPSPYNEQAHALLIEYVDIRLTTVTDLDEVEAIEVQSNEILDQLWGIALTVGNENPESIVVGLFVDALNNTIDVNGERIFAVESTRLPIPIVLGVYVIAGFGLMLVGFSNGTHGNRSVIPMVVTALVFSVVITLITDLDRPQEGLLRISQQPMIDLQTQMHADD